jgi:hypothetical protein
MAAELAREQQGLWWQKVQCKLFAGAVPSGDGVVDCLPVSPVLKGLGRGFNSCQLSSQPSPAPNISVHLKEKETFKRVLTTKSYL